MSLKGNLKSVLGGYFAFIHQLLKHPKWFCEELGNETPYIPASVFVMG